MSARRPIIAASAGLALLAMLTAGAAAGGASRAGGTFADASGQSIGWVRLVEDGTGKVHVNVHVAGLTAGRHGIHLHAVGQCVGPTFASAGGHHNPDGAEHGLDNPDGPHAGDLPNLVVNVAGRGHLDAVSHHATLSSGPALLDADGSAIVIHAFEDDQVTNPTGNSGPRVACGVIEAT